MTALISVYRSGGVCVGRCDARCHNAKAGTPCNCICGGSNHGVGGDQALENVTNYTQERLDEIRAKGGIIPDDLKQRDLFSNGIK
jgi:hypothetical protein